jgi:competence protein ComFC
VKRLWDGLLDLVYPPRCLICDRWDAPSVCEACALGFLKIPEPSCVVCGRPIDSDLATICRNCTLAADLWGGWAFEQARAAAIFQGPMRVAIHQLKYKSVAALAEPLGGFLANRILVDGLLEINNFEAIVPVPITEKKQKQRGFNQSELLARPLAEQLSLPILTVQRLAGSGPAQATLSPEARRRTVTSDAFLVPNAEAISGKKLLVIDDVFTTGATVQALSAVLHRAGASQLTVITLAAGG